MAAALIVKRAREHRRRLRVASAGIAAFVGEAPPRDVVSLMQRLGFDISGHKAQQLTGVLARRYDLMLVMDRTQQHFVETHWPDLKGRVYRLGAWRGEDVADPFGLTEQCFVDCLNKIETCVADWEALWSGQDPTALPQPAA
jgi:protein-tyrosine phosphatase